MAFKQQTWKNAAPAGIFVLQYGAHGILVPPPIDHDQLQQSIHRYFPELPVGPRASYYTKELDICEGSLIEVSPDIWATVVPMIKKLTVWVEPGPSASSVGTGKRKIQEEMESECFSSDEDLKMGKPVIYLLPPSGVDVDATVKLSLVPEWEFSVVYPVVPIIPNQAGGHALEWHVKASSDGTLLEKNTGLEVTYLFWEAETPKGANELLSPPSSPTLEQATLGSVPQTFTPEKPHVDIANSVVLKVSKMTPYLDNVLKGLGLHTEARTSFITYWLPSFLKHQYVALCFLPQTVYEKAAPLEVSPAPDVVARIFMLFKGLKGDEVQGAWNTAFDGSQGDTKRWRSIVGVDGPSLGNTTLFRVVEWGGMEVL